MNSIISSRTKFIFNFFVVVFAFVGFSFSANAQSFGISPGRVEMEVKPGTERTTVMVVEYAKEEAAKELPNIRIIGRIEDWGLKPNGELMTASAGTQPRSAANWIIFSPAEFTIAGGTKQAIRLTISVPAETRPGDYYAALYVEDRNPPPPPTNNNPQLNIRYRFYSLIYVMVPNLTRKGELTNLEAHTENGKAVINATLKNSGNSHIRGVHSVEFQDESGKTVAEIPKKEATVLLGDSEMTLKLSLDKPLPVGKYKVVYTMDFGAESPIQVGKTILEIKPENTTLLGTSKETVDPPAANASKTTPSVDPSVTTPRKP